MRHYYDFDYDYGYTTPAFDSMVTGIVLVIVIALFLWMIFSLISYILKGIGMYTIAKRQGRDYAWLAFIPFARTYLHGELAGSIRLKKRTIQNPGIWLLAMPFIYGAVYSVMYVVIWFLGFGTIMKYSDSYYYGYSSVEPGAILGAVVLMLVFSLIVLAYTALYKTFSILVNHQILECFTSKNMSIVHAILCSVVPLYESICLFVMRNKPFNPGMEPATPPPFMQTPPPGPYYHGPGPQVPPYGYQGGNQVPPYDPGETASWKASDIPTPQGDENQGNPWTGAAEGRGNSSAGAAGNPWEPVQSRESSFSNFASSQETKTETAQPEGSDVMRETSSDAGSIWNQPSNAEAGTAQSSNAGSIWDQPSNADAGTAQSSNGSIWNQPSGTEAGSEPSVNTGSILDQPSDADSGADQSADQNTDSF